MNSLSKITSNDSGDYEYRLTHDIKYYETVKKMVSGVISNKDIVVCLKLAAPDKCDVLDYNCPVLKYYVDKCVKHNVPILCSIKHYQYRERELLLAHLKDSMRVSERMGFTDLIDSFIVSDWVQIQPFLLNLNYARKGEQHKMCMKLMRCLNDAWESTYYHNSNKDVSKLVDKFRQLFIVCSIRKMDQIRRKDKFCDRFHTQMFENLAAMPSMFVDSCQKMGQMSDGITKLANRVDGFFDYMSQLILQFQNKLQGFGNMFTIVNYIGKMISLGYLLMEPKNQNIASITALLMMALPNEVLGNLSTLVTDLIRVLQDVIRKFKSSVEQVFVTQMDDDRSIFSSFYSATIGIFQGIFKDIPSEHFKSMRLSVNKMQLLSDYVKTSTNIVSFIAKMLEKMVVFIGDRILKYYGYLPKFIKDESIELCVTKFIFIKDNGYDLSCRQNKIHAAYVMDLYKELLKVQMQLQIKAGKYINFDGCRILPFLHVMVCTLEKYIAFIPPHVKDKVDVRKCKPYWCYIYGDPRIGKSAVLQPYMTNALAKALKFVDHYTDPAAYVFARNCGDKYWEQYNNQPVVAYNDIFQNFKDEQAMHTAILELTNVIDDAPYPLNMAALESKGCTYFTSQVVISNAQADIVGQKFVEDICWSRGKHIHCRRNVSLEMKLNPKYATADKLIDFSKVLKEIQDPNVYCFPEKLVGDPTEPMFPADMYWMYFHDVQTGAKLFEEPMMFLEAIDYVCKDAVAYQQRQLGFKNKLFEHFEKTWNTQMDQPNTTTEVKEDVFEPAVSVFDFSFKASLCSCAQFFMELINEGALAHLPIDAYMQVINLFVPGNHHYCIRTKKEALDVLDACTYIFIKEGFVGARLILAERKSYFQRFVGKIKDFWSTRSELTQLLTIFFSVYFGVGLLALGIQSYFTSKPQEEQCQPQSSEANNKPKLNKIRRKKNTTFFSVQAYQSVNRDIESRLDLHFARIHFITNVDGVEHISPTYGNLLCVGGDVFIMPRHYWLRFSELNDLYTEQGYNSFIQLSWNQKQDIKVRFVDCQHYYPPYEHSNDICFVRIKDLCCMRDLRAFFQTENDNPNLYNCYLYGFRSKRCESVAPLQPTMLTVGSSKLTSMKYSSGSPIDKITGKALKNLEFNIPICYMYDMCYTEFGDCGLAYLGMDSTMGCRQFLGIHTGGSSGTHQGIASPVFKEDVDEAFDFFKNSGTVITIQSGTDYIDWGLNPTSTLLHDDHCKDLLVVGRAGKINGKPIKTSMASRSKIQQSVVFDVMEEDFGPHTQEPARLFKCDIDGKLVSPMALALGKLNQKGFYVDQDKFDLINDHITSTILSWRTNYSIYPRLLTDFESINGMDGLKPLDMRTSAGFPYVFNNVIGGKQDLFDITIYDNEFKTYVAKPLLQRNIDMREDLAKQGVIAETYFVDKMKDETRLIEKVVAGKTRIFQVGPVDLSILMRKYFGFFIAHCQASFLDGEMAIGINPNSVDWTIKMKTFLAMSDRFINGDYSNYDASIWHQCCECVIKAANDFYNDSDENKLIRRVLIKTCLSSYHIVDDIIFFFRQGNPSGNVLTTIINIIVNMFCARYAYLRLVNGTDLHKFNELVKAWFYGDDNLLAIHKSIQHLMNMVTYSNIMQELNMIYTTPDKSEIKILLYDIHAIDFLKRKFIKDKKYNIYLAQLNEDVVMEIARWSECDPTRMEDQLNRFNTTLLEIANYGKQKFDKIQQIFKKYCYNLIQLNYTIDPTRLFTYYYCMEIMYPEFFTQKQVYDLTPLSKGLNDVVHTLGGNRDVGKLSDYNLSEDNTLSQIEFHSIGNLLSKKETQEYINSFVVEKTIEPQSSEVKNNIPKPKNVRFSPIKEENEQFKTQAGSDDIVSSQEQNVGTTVQTITTTQLIDDSELHEADIRTFQHLPHNSMPPVNLDMFLKRPYALTTFDWVATNTVGTLMSTISLPAAFVSAIPTINDKLSYIAFWRPDMEIAIRLNGTKMHYGRLIACWVPMDASLNVWYKQFENASHWPFIQCSASSDQVVTMTIPYSAISDYYVPSNTGTWGSVYIYVAAPLSSVSGAASRVEVTVYARIIETRLAGYKWEDHLLSPTFMTQMENGNSESIKRSKEGTLVSTLSDISSDITRGIKLIGDIGCKASSLVSTDKMLAKYLGASIGPNYDTVKPIHHRQPRWGQVEDLPNSVVLGPSMDACLKKDPSSVHGELDDMSIVKFCQRPCLIFSGTITSTNAKDDVLFNRFVSPRDMFYGTTAASSIPVAGDAAGNGYFGIPMQFISRYFQFWRGGIRFHVSFIASHFHACRVRILYNPYIEITADTPNFIHANSLVNIVCDITKQTDYSFTVPYMQPYPWARFDDTDPGTTNNIGTNGGIFITMMNTLTSGETTINPIYFQVFASAATDLQFASPTLQYILNLGVWKYPPPTLLKEDKVEKWDVKQMLNDMAQDSDEDTCDEDCKHRFTTQMDDGAGWFTAECTFPSSSSKCMHELEYPNIGGVAGGITSHRMEQSFEVTSIKQLCNMMSIFRQRAQPAVEPTDVTIHGVGLVIPGTITPTQSAQFYQNWLLQMMSVFRYYRGGFRVIAMHSDPGAQFLAWAGHNLGDSAVFMSDLDVAPFLNTFNNLEWNSTQMWSPRVAENTIDVVVPYYSRFRCRLINYGTNVSSGFTNDYDFLKIGGASSAIEWMIYYGLAGCDDFWMGFPTSIPKAVYLAP
jgi:hypothetical protein